MLFWALEEMLKCEQPINITRPCENEQSTQQYKSEVNSQTQSSNSYQAVLIEWECEHWEGGEQTV